MTAENKERPLQSSLRYLAVKAIPFAQQASTMLDPKDLRNLEQAYGQQMLGQGKQNIAVVTLSGMPDLAIAFSRNGLTESDARILLLKHELANILFPHNFPPIIDAYGLPEGTDFSFIPPFQRGWTIRKVISKSHEAGPSNHPLQAIFPILQRYAIPFYLEFHPKNLVHQADGEKYIDTISEAPITRSDARRGNPWRSADVNSLIEFMRGHANDGKAKHAHLNPTFYNENGYAEEQIQRVREIIFELQQVEYF